MKETVTKEGQMRQTPIEILCRVDSNGMKWNKAKSHFKNVVYKIDRIKDYYIWIDDIDNNTGNENKTKINDGPENISKEEHDKLFYVIR